MPLDLEAKRESSFRWRTCPPCATGRTSAPSKHEQIVVVAASSRPHNTTSVNSKGKSRFAPHGYVGLAIILFAELLLFRGNQIVGHWFTPIIWTGYILFVDALVYQLESRSLLTTERLEFVLIVLISIGGWWLC